MSGAQLGRRVRALEGKGGLFGFPPSPSKTELEAWAIDAEIREIEEEMLAEGLDPYRGPSEGPSEASQSHEDGF